MEKEKEGQPLPYTILKNSKTGEEYKICNFDLIPRTGIIEIEAMRKPEIDPNGGLRSDYNVTIRCSKDPNTDIIYGIPVGFHQQTGEPRWLPITLGSQTYFDRSIPDQARKAFVALHDFRMENSPTLNQKPMFKVRDKDKAAQEKIKKFLAADEARAVAKTFIAGSEELEDFALALGLQVQSYSPVMLFAAVLDEANNNPVLFNTLYNDPDRKVLVVLKRGVAQGVVVQDQQLGYTFNGLTLGNNEANAIHFLKTKPDIQQSIAIHTASKKIETEKANKKGAAYNPVKELAKTPVIDPEKEALEKRLAKLEEENAALKKDKAKPEKVK